MAALTVPANAENSPAVACERSELYAIPFRQIQKNVKRKPTPSPLLYAGSETSADQFYFTHFLAGDPFIAFGAGRKRCGVFSMLELGRAQKESSLDIILPLTEWQKRAKRYASDGVAGPAEVIKALARSYKIRRFAVPSNFPAGLLLKLRNLGVQVDVADGEFFTGTR